MLSVCPSVKIFKHLLIPPLPIFTRLGLPMKSLYTLSPGLSLTLHLRSNQYWVRDLRKYRLGLPVYIVIHLVRSELLQRSTRNFEIRRQVLRVTKNAHLSLSLYLSIRQCTFIFPKGCACTSVSLSNLPNVAIR